MVVNLCHVEKEKESCSLNGCVKKSTMELVSYSFFMSISLLAHNKIASIITFKMSLHVFHLSTVNSLQIRTHGLSFLFESFPIRTSSLMFIGVFMFRKFWVNFFTIKNPLEISEKMLVSVVEKLLSIVNINKYICKHCVVYIILKLKNN